MKQEKNVDFKRKKGKKGKKTAFVKNCRVYIPPFALTSRDGTVIIDMYILMGGPPA